MIIDTRSTRDDYRMVWRNNHTLRVCPAYNLDHARATLRRFLTCCAIGLALWIAGLLTIYFW
jgi:hypothetical protein